MALTSANHADAPFGRTTDREARLIDDGIDDFLPEGSVARVLAQMRRIRPAAFVVAAVLIVVALIGAVAGGRILMRFLRSERAAQAATAAAAQSPTEPVEKASSVAVATPVRKSSSGRARAVATRPAQADTRSGAFSSPTPAPSSGVVSATPPRATRLFAAVPVAVADAAAAPSTAAAAHPDTTSPVAPARPDTTIYSAEDFGVTPPKMLSSELPRPIFASLPTITNAMELIVSPAGEVEHVRLVADPRRMTDMMILSAAKLWKFAPAMRDGHPVRYRLVVTWQVNP